MELDIEKTEAPEEIEVLSCMSVAEEAEGQPNGSKDITLAVSMSELEHMSTSGVICDQDIAGWGGGETGHNLAAMSVYEGEDIILYCRGTGRVGGHEFRASPPMSAKLTLEVKVGENSKNKSRESDSHLLRARGVAARKNGSCH